MHGKLTRKRERPQTMLEVIIILESVQFSKNQVGLTTLYFSRHCGYMSAILRLAKRKLFKQQHAHTNTPEQNRFHYSNPQSKGQV